MAGRIILTLGMHRSGTSLIAKATECLGANLGHRARWNAPDNPKGFSEDLDVLSFDEEFLQSMGTSWDDPKEWPVAQIMPHVAYVAKFLRWRLAEHPLFALKEPRMCRLLPFWSAVFKEVRCEVSAVHAVRHPMSVAKSLLKRNGLSIENGLALWLEYNRRARLDADPTWKAVTVNYDAMMALPAQQVRRMGEALGLKPNEHALQKFATQFVDSTMWHELDTPDEPTLPSIEVAAAWALIRKEAFA